jgi:predicted ATPase/DNA-binding SARP family transcriptional activator
MPNKLELALLGNLEVRRDGFPATDLRSRKAQALLCYLAVTGRSHSRPALAGLLWGDMPEAKARVNLSQALSNLRRSFGDHLTITRQMVAFNGDSDYWLDIEAFEADVNIASARAPVKRMQEAVKLYRGDFLDGFYVRGAPEFEMWVLAQRARLRELALQALHRLIAHYAEQGKAGRAAAIEYTSCLLALEPWREEAHRQMMRLLALNGQRSAALVQYEKCRQALADELDVEPAAETTALYEQIRDGDLEKEARRKGDLTPSPQHNLPAQTTPLIGRGVELAELDRLLTDPAVRLVTITGPGGIGKTRLATAIAHQMAEAGCFRDGVVFAPLTPITARSLLTTTIAERLGLSLAGTPQPEKTLLDFVRGRDYLLVLDNFEQLLPEADFLARLLEVAPWSKLLVTSRERLTLPEEWVLDLEGLPYPGTVQEAQSSDYDAVNLFFQRGRQAWSNFSLEGSLAGVVRICQLTQGMPLALEHAASLIRVCHAGEIADQIESSLDSLSTAFRNLPERHRSMRAVFDGSWRWLSEEERKVFCRLSVFRGGFTRKAAEQVAGASLSVLASLVDKSLLRRCPGQGETTRYDLHELVRQYAADRLLEVGQAEVAQAHDAHLDFFLSLAERTKQFWGAEQEKQWLKRLEPERSNLNAALRWATEHAKAEHALRLNAALVTFWIYSSPKGEASDWLESSLSMPWDKRSLATMRARAEALIVAGHAALQTSNLELAKARFQEGGELCSKLGDRRRLAWSLRGSGFVCLIRGDLAEAQTFVEESRSICREIQNKWCLAWSLYELGNIALARTELAQAEQLLNDALELLRQQNKELGAFRSLISLGHLGRAQGNWLEAKARYGEALAIQQETGYIQFVAQILEGIAHIAVADNTPEVAVQFFGAAQARRDSIEMARWAHQDIEYQHSLALTRNQLPAAVWQAAWDEGYLMTHQQGVVFALNWLSS